MGFISDEDQISLRDLFEKNLESDVEIVLYTEKPSLIVIPGKDECLACVETEQLLGEVASLSEKLKLTVNYMPEAAEQAAGMGIDKVPAFVLEGAARGNVRFFGIPSGHEFSAFIADLLDTSAGTSELSDETIQFLGALEKDVHLKVFTTPT